MPYYRDNLNLRRLSAAITNKVRHLSHTDPPFSSTRTSQQVKLTLPFGALGERGNEQKCDGFRPNLDASEMDSFDVTSKQLHDGSSGCSSYQQRACEKILLNAASKQEFHAQDWPHMPAVPLKTRRTRESDTWKTLEQQSHKTTECPQDLSGLA